MNRRLRLAAAVLCLAFLAVVGDFTYLQAVASGRLTRNPLNQRVALEQFEMERGVVVAGGEILAESLREPGSRLYLRRYPGGRSGDPRVYAHVTGYFSLFYGRSGLESSMDSFLAGSASQYLVRSFLEQLAGAPPRGLSVELTLLPRAQEAAARAMGGQRGAVVALDPLTGAVLALYSSPSFDPNPISSLDPGAARGAMRALEADPAFPLFNRATAGGYPPGSSFKVVVAAAALEAGMKPTSRFANTAVLALPGSDKVVRNFGGGPCPGGKELTLAEALRVSCNVVYAQVAMELGPKLVEVARGFGIETGRTKTLQAVTWGDPVPGSVTLPSYSGWLDAGVGERRNRALEAYVGFGQGPLEVSPLEMALVAATVASGGVRPRPYLVQRVRDYAGRIVWQAEPAQGKRVIAPETAAALRDMMVQVVRSGTGTRAAIPGVEVAGKTGTAEVGGGGPPHAWFIAFAPASSPRVAVAVVVENGGNLGDEATGGMVAAPIARAVIEAVIGGGEVGRG